MESGLIFMMKYKIIISDYDKTLTTTDRRITDRTKDAIKKFQDNGGKFVLCTSRNLVGIETARVPLGIDVDALILNQGATIYDMKEKKYIAKNVLSREEVNDILGYLKNKTSNFLILFDKGGHCRKNNLYPKICNFVMASAVTPIGDKIFDYYNEDGVTQFFIGSMFASKMRHMAKRAKKYFDGKYEIGLCDKHSFNITKKGVTKGKGIEKVLEYYGLTKEEAIAFGDSQNDETMLTSVGLGVAMGNSMKELKCVADRICDTCDNDGMAQFIEENVL